MFLEPNIWGGPNFMEKETGCINNCTLYMCLCLPAKGVLIWDELPLLSMTVDIKFRCPLIWYCSNINYLAPGKKYSDLERVTAITSKQLSKKPLCKTKQCQDYSSNIGPEFELSQQWTMFPTAAGDSGAGIKKVGPFSAVRDQRVSQLQGWNYPPIVKLWVPWL